MQQDIEKQMENCITSEHVFTLGKVLERTTFICHTCRYAVKKTCHGLVLMQ